MRTMETDSSRAAMSRHDTLFTKKQTQKTQGIESQEGGGLTVIKGGATLMNLLQT